MIIKHQEFFSFLIIIIWTNGVSSIFDFVLSCLVSVIRVIGLVSVIVSSVSSI